MVDKYLATEEELEPLDWGQIAKTSAIAGATVGGVAGGAAGLGIATIPFAIAGAIIGTVTSVSVALTGAALSQAAEALYVFGSNRQLRESIRI